MRKTKNVKDEILPETDIQTPKQKRLFKQKQLQAKKLEIEISAFCSAPTLIKSTASDRGNRG